MADETSELPPDASAWERDLYKHLTNHTRNEGKLLAEYVDVAQGTESKALSYLLDLLVQDEHRHHGLFDALAHSLKSQTELDPDPEVPLLDFHKVETTELLAQTRTLLAHEREDQKELKRLRKELRDFEDTSLWGLLVELMERDTEKHIAMLEFVEKHATRDHHRV
jgi:rubrerythrin